MRHLLCVFVGIGVLRTIWDSPKRGQPSTAAQGRSKGTEVAKNVKGEQYFDDLTHFRICLRKSLEDRSYDFCDTEIPDATKGAKDIVAEVNDWN